MNSLISKRNLLRNLPELIFQLLSTTEIIRKINDKLEKYSYDAFRPLGLHGTIVMLTLV